MVRSMLHCSVFQCWHHLRWFEILWPCSKILFPVRAVSVQFLVPLLRPSSLGAVLVRFIWDHLIFIWRFCGVEGFYPLSEQFQSSSGSIHLGSFDSYLKILWSWGILPVLRAVLVQFWSSSGSIRLVSFDCSTRNLWSWGNLLAFRAVPVQ